MLIRCQWTWLDLVPVLESSTHLPLQLLLSGIIGSVKPVARVELSQFWGFLPSKMNIEGSISSFYAFYTSAERGDVEQSAALSLMQPLT